MLLFNLPLLFQHPALFAALMGCVILALVLAITVHEASHALVATWQGDNTAHAHGRLSLNPLRHMDPTGTAMMLLVGFGWGRPVPVNPYWLRSGPRIGGALVALAGPASNLLAAALIAIPVRLGILAWHSPMGAAPFASTSLAWIASDVVGFIVFYNLILAVFNLLPVAPLDGFRVALGVLPREIAGSFARLEPYGPGILMLLLLMGYLPMINFDLWNILGPVVRTIGAVVVGRSL